MVAQIWFGNTSQKLLGVLRKQSYSDHRLGILFLPGFGQTMAGTHFLFTRLAQQLSSVFPTFQFDYRGWGDSEGETSDCTVESLLRDAEMAAHELQKNTKCKKLVLVGAGFGNWIAAKIGRQHGKAALILLAPYRSPVSLEETFGKFMPAEDDTLIDTARLGDWTQLNPLVQFFRELGSGKSHAKGILVRWQFVVELAAINAADWLRDYPGPVLEFYSPTDGPLKAVSHQKSIALPHSGGTFYIKNRDFIEREVTSWLMGLDGEFE